MSRSSSTTARMSREILVRDLMTPADELATLSPEATLLEAAELLDSRHVEAAPVLAGSTLAGVVSVTDLVAFAAWQPELPEGPAGPEWGEWPQAEEWEEGVEPPAAFYQDLWLDAGGDLADALAEISAAGGSAFSQHTVSEVMTRRILSIQPSAPARTAAQAMLRASVHRLLVMDDGRLAGLLTTSDLVAAVADGRLHAGAPA